MTDEDVINFLMPKALPCNLIRVGRSGDGGYIVPLEHIVAAKSLISFGVGDDISFEQHIKHINPNIVIDLYDGTTPKLPANLKCTFHNENVYFKHMNPFDAAPDCTICKCDIEGEEYNLIHVPVNSLSNIMTLIIEIHDIKEHKNDFVNLLSFLSFSGFNTIHIHGNNHRSSAKLFDVTIPDTLEITLSKYPVNGVSKYHYPIQGLDCPCCSWLPEISLDFINDRIRESQ